MKWYKCTAYKSNPILKKKVVVLVPFQFDRENYLRFDNKGMIFVGKLWGFPTLKRMYL